MGEGKGLIENMGGGGGEGLDREHEGEWKEREGKGLIKSMGGGGGGEGKGL